MKKDTNSGTEDGVAKNLTTEEKLENLARNVFILIEKQKEMGVALDNVYIQVATLIEVLADKEEILNPEIWEEKLKEVTQNIKDTMEGMINEAGDPGKGAGKASGGQNAEGGASKIIVPDNRIIIPGQ